MQQKIDQFFFVSVDSKNSELWLKEDQIPKKMVLSKIKLFEGNLFVKSKKKDFWKSRFFVLWSDRLSLLKNGREKKLPSTMFLSHVYLEHKSANENEKFPIILISDGRRQILHARSQESRDKWIKYLSQTCILSDYRERYTNIKVLGKGTFAKVLLAQRNADKKQYAVKTFQKSALQDKSNKQRMGLLNEINLLRLCDHPNIIKLYEIHESQEYIYLVMELLEGGDLFQTIMDTKAFQEKTVAKIMFKIFDCLEYLHSQQIMHRDLKPENIVLKDKSDSFDLKLADFGLASTLTSDFAFTRCGTPGYVAPEILEDMKYDEKVDIFGAGVILYILLTGTSPFMAHSLDEILEKNRYCQISYDFAEQGLTISSEATDLLQKILVTDPKKRISASEALHHKFISQHFKKENTLPDLDEEEIEDLPNDNYSAYENMKKFQQERFQLSKLKPTSLVQQTPLMGGQRQTTNQNDSWLNEKSPTTEIKQSKSQFQDDQEYSPLTTLAETQKKKYSPFQMKQIQAPMVQKQQPPTHNTQKRASQVKELLKKMDI